MLLSLVLVQTSKSRLEVTLILRIVQVLGAIFVFIGSSRLGLILGLLLILWVGLVLEWSQGLLD